MVSWNSVPACLEYKYYSGSRRAPASNKKLLVLAGLLALIAHYISPVTGGGGAWAIFTIGCYVVAALSILLLVVQNFLSVGKPSPSPLTFNPRQRQLLGLGTVQAKQPEAPTTRKSLPEALIPPPNKATSPFLPPSMVASAEENLSMMYSPSPGSRGSRGNVTPDQLQRALKEFDDHVNASASTVNGHGLVTGGPDFGAYGVQTGMALHPSSTPPGTYRPSATARGATAAPIRPDGRISQSRPSQRAAIVEQLGTSEDLLEVVIEKLREWFATEILQPLENAADCAHINVVNAAVPVGFPGIRLTALNELGSEVSAKTADDRVTLSQLRHRIDELLRNPSYQHYPQLNSCKQAIINYQELLLVLRGEFPSGLLPPAPDGYILKRVKELSNGSCMIDFNWDKGGDWNGKPWSTELPTDSALLLYLFAAFLAAPQWRFANEDPNRIEGPTGILYLGKIPPRVNGEYDAIIPSRPPAGGKGNGILGLQLGSQQPHFSLLINGEGVLTETGQGALFFIISLFLQHCSRAGGNIGGRSLAYLHLDSVLEPQKRMFSLYNFRKLRIW